MPGSRDIALISLGTTPGLRRADEAFRACADAAGVSCEVIQVQIGATGKLRRQMTVTDAVEARAARSAVAQADARVVVFSAVTTALLARPPGPYAIRFDSPALLNRPGAAGLWQRAAERRAMGAARALLPWGDAAAASVPRGIATPVIPLHVPIPMPPAAQGERIIDVLAYAGYPEKRGLDILVRAWTQFVAATSDAEPRLVIAGIDRERGEEWLRQRQVPVPSSVDWLGLLPRDEWTATLARTRIFVNASRREDHGLSQLEALAAGAMLVTVPSVGPYEALALARRLDPDLVTTAIAPEPLARALTAAFKAERAPYAAEARAELAPYAPDAVQRVFAHDVLPALGLR